jgi:hypothetical protein
MGAIYNRQSSFADGDTITAALFNNELDQLQAAFAASTGHTHDGTTGEGGPITVLGPAQDISVGSTQILPVTDDAISLGSATKEFKDAYFDGTVNLDALVIGTSTAITSVDTDLSSVSASDDTLASAKAIKTYIDAQVTAQDLDFQGDSGGALSIDLDSETLTIAGGTGIDTSGATNTLTVAIDSTVATLSGTQTLTNKTISADSNTLSGIAASSFVLSNASGNIDGSAAQKAIPSGVVVGTTDTQTLTNKTLTTPIISSISNTGTLTLPTSTDTLVGRATTDTLTNKTINLSSNTLTGTLTQFNTALSGADFASLAGTETLTNKTINASNNTVSNITVSMLAGSAVVTEAEGISSNDNDTTLPTSAAVKDYVDSAVASENELSEMNDVTITSVTDNEVLAYDSTSSKWINQTYTEAGLAPTAGSTSITTLGTITTGVWTGTAIGDSYISSSSNWNTAYGWGNHASAGYAVASNNLSDLTNSATAISNLGITSTAAELNKLDGFTGTYEDLNYAKDLRATGVTTTEYDYLDGVTSNIQTQIDASNANALAFAIALG